ncbi:hypothetical protein HNY73_011550 [Argiope bruennichi]|uniref:Uncharacterized protein n=1 Tax=Argiope bruennichi TaxID=94029 RepID=A0A8T0F488_ARGBR|nr:hypothetical protein HNY73_011550 [Argiope bruennichi]
MSGERQARQSGGETPSQAAPEVGPQRREQEDGKIKCSRKRGVREKRDVVWTQFVGRMMWSDGGRARIGGARARVEEAKEREGRRFADQIEIAQGVLTCDAKYTAVAEENGRGSGEI